jgi:hypothetical protein
VAAAAASAESGDFDAAPRFASAVSDHEAAVRRLPGLRRGLPDLVARRLEEGIPVAQKRLREFASCGALFTRLGSDGVVQVGGASYHAASPEQERRYCRRGVEALASVGGSTIALCRTFAHLSSQQAAIILIHEALHLAGQEEYPASTGAPDSRAITETVMASCQLS